MRRKLTQKRQKITRKAQEEDEEDAITCEPCGDPYLIIAKSPHSPTEEEKERHYTTHLPYRSWCPICVQARGKEDSHKSAKKKHEGEPTIVMD